MVCFNLPLDKESVNNNTHYHNNKSDKDKINVFDGVHALTAYIYLFFSSQSFACPEGNF